jgi:hypothetical protein
MEKRYFVLLNYISSRNALMNKNIKFNRLRMQSLLVRSVFHLSLLSEECSNTILSELLINIPGSSYVVAGR